MGKRDFMRFNLTWALEGYLTLHMPPQYCGKRFFDLASSCVNDDKMFSKNLIGNDISDNVTKILLNYNFHGFRNEAYSVRILTFLSLQRSYLKS